MISIKSVEELKDFLNKEVISTIEAAEILDCSRQNIKRIVDNGKLVPIKELERDRLFLKQDVLKRKEEMDMKKVSKK
ncbi:helix-turn-helix domain-containing protein [Cytobacillus sp. FSL R5-0569]|uniref:helix-turn-helix domain-containing protein n=1 Tax=unclassified Cytobacillus TaxID=2675268 RepID=UPI0030F7B1B6